MNMRRMAALAEKDLRESTANSQVILPMAIVPLIFVVLYPAGLLLALRLPNALKELSELAANVPKDMVPALAGLDLRAAIAYWSTVYLFAPFFLLIPVMVATILAANSFAGEKERHTIEGLLYTPLSDTELFLGKAAGVVIPSVAFTWLCFAVYAVLVNALGFRFIGRIFFPTVDWWVLMLLVVPAASVLVTIITTWISARVRGFQEANSMAGAAVLPIMALVVGQVTGIMFVGTAMFAALGVVLVFADVLLGRWIIGTFDRERAVSSYT